MNDCQCRQCCNCCKCQAGSWPKLKEYKYVITGTKRKPLTYIRTTKIWVHEGDTPIITVRYLYEKNGVEKEKMIVCKPISNDVMVGVWE